MKLTNSRTSKIVAIDLKVADKYFSRLRGLIGTRSLPKGSGLIIEPCNSIHMFFMKYPIDVIFLDKDNVVLHVINGIKPWNISQVVKQARKVIELPEGTIKASGVDAGDILLLE